MRNPIFQVVLLAVLAFLLFKGFQVPMPPDGQGAHVMMGVLSAVCGLGALAIGYRTWGGRRAQSAGGGSGLEEVLGMGFREPTDRIAAEAQKLTDGTATSITLVLKPVPGRAAFLPTVTVEPASAQRAKGSIALKQAVDALAAHEEKKGRVQPTKLTLTRNGDVWTASLRFTDADS